jgi:hypothetical protein
MANLLTSGGPGSTIEVASSMVGKHIDRSNEIRVIVPRRIASGGVSY